MNVIRFGLIWFSCNFYYWKPHIEFKELLVICYLINSLDLEEIHFVSFVMNKIWADKHCVFGHMIFCQNSFFEFSTYITGGEYGKKVFNYPYDTSKDHPQARKTFKTIHNLIHA